MSCWPAELAKSTRLPYDPCLRLLCFFSRDYPYSLFFLFRSNWFRINCCYGSRFLCSHRLVIWVTFSGLGLHFNAVKICCEANPQYFLAANGTVAELALGKSNDPHQQWIKHDKWGIETQDTKGFPAFALVNKATKSALKHGDQSLDQVTLGDYDDDTAEDSALWTFTADVGGGYHVMRDAKDVSLNLDAKGGKVQNGTHLILYQGNGLSNQKWKAQIVHA